MNPRHIALALALIATTALGACDPKPQAPKAAAATSLDADGSKVSATEVVANILG